jgi:hypothetical protein
MIVMPANCSGWIWHSLARETGRLGHLYSPGGERGPWPWFPFALDNGAFSCWDPETNVFDYAKWAIKEEQWRRLLFWAQAASIKPRWAIVPDVPGNAIETLKRWAIFAREVQDSRIPLAVAVQDGMTVADIQQLQPTPDVICIGGTTEWKWATVEQWAKLGRCHLLRCSSVEKLDYLESLGIESCDSTAWNRGDRHIRLAGLELWCRKRATPTQELLWPFACRGRSKEQLTFA